MRWRWDQGRLDYFRFDAIREIATTQCGLENVKLQTTPDPLRGPLQNDTGLPFAPQDYTVWRNYKRVFGCCLLAIDVDKKVICTEVCHQLAGRGAELSADAYFSHFAKAFYYPSPIFEGYENRGTQHFPVCAILKFLLAKLRNGQPAVTTPEEILYTLVANKCTGDEPVSHYQNLNRNNDYEPAPDELRQLRELVRFISQLSILKWVQPNLFLDIEPTNAEALKAVESLAQPLHRPRKGSASEELLQLGQTGQLPVLPLASALSGDTDVSFSEGKAKRVTHLRYERSPKLREFYFTNIHPPFLCDMCKLNSSARYPWTVNMLELHHLLPLASPLRVENARTSLSELVAVCPNCHKATHLFYKEWLDDNHQDDFASYKQARDVYEIAKSKLVTHN